MELIQFPIKTSVCPLFLVANDQHLCGIHFEKQDLPIGSNRVLKETEKQLIEYFAGQRQTFDLPLSTEGTAFQKKVWQALCKIPYAKTRSYKDIATTIDHEKAYRAVGTANGCNPICIVIPCHRVIAADGSLGGFGGGLEIKEKLLSLEKKYTDCLPSI